MVVMPQDEKGVPLLYDFTYFKKGKQMALAVGNNDLEAAIRKEYAADAANPNFKTTFRSNLDEVEAAHYGQVGEYYGERNPRMMEEAYKRAVVLAPNELKYNWNLAVAYEKQDKWKDALDIYKRCATEFEEGKINPRILGALGSAYAATGNIIDAKKFLERALELNPNKELGKKIENNLRAITK
ncbi:MAG: tetratricopeptide repeat protein [Candidatus Micrarchaeota archaeon]